MKQEIIGVGRNIVVPLLGFGLSEIGLTKEEITTRVIYVMGGDIGNCAVDVTSDFHAGGVIEGIDQNIIATQKSTSKILEGTSKVISADLGDLLTSGSNFWRNKGIQHALPTSPADLINTATFWEENARRGQGGKIYAVTGNHERDLGKMGLSSDDINRLFGMLKEFGISYFTDPLCVGERGTMQLLQMPCFDTSAEPFTRESMQKLIDQINRFQGLSIIMTHNPDGPAYIEKYQIEQNKNIIRPALFLCGHSHGLLGLQGVVNPFGNILSGAARKWLKLGKDTEYVSGFYKLSRGGGIFVHQGMGDQKGLRRYLKGSRERIVFQFTKNPKKAEINLNN